MSGKRAVKVVLTDRAVRALPNAPKGKRVTVWDASLQHFGVRVTENGAKSFFVQRRIKGKKAPVTHMIGPYPGVSLGKARELAKEALELMAGGLVPRAERLRTIEAERALESANFEVVAKDFIEKHLVNNRTRGESERIINTYLIPTFGKHQIADVKRREIAELLDDLEHGRFKNPASRACGGPVMADRVLAHLRKLTRWYATRNEDYVSPIIPYMARTRPKDRARDRILSDHEIRALWAALDEADLGRNDRKIGEAIFAALVRMLLLTAQRRDDVAAMRPSEITADGIWTIPAERYKTNKAQVVPLSKLARMVLEGAPTIGDRQFVFTTDGKTPFSGFSKAKADLDKSMLKHLRKDAEARDDEHLMAFVSKIMQLKGKAAKSDKTARTQLKESWWWLHDLRRTGKTLMIRSGVRPDISERVIGHAIKGVEGVYDRWEYRDEKRHALETLAETIEHIVHQ